MCTVINFRAITRAVNTGVAEDPILFPYDNNYLIWAVGGIWPDEHLSKGFTKVYWSAGECKAVSSGNSLETLYIFVIPAFLIATAPLKNTYVGRLLRLKRIISSFDVSWGSGIIIVSYLVVVLLLSGLRIKDSLDIGNDGKRSFLVGTGDFVLMNLWLSMLPNSKSPVWMVLVGSPFERAIKYHRGLAAISLWAAASHLILASYLLPDRLFSSALQGNAIPLYGMLAFICFAAMGLSALPSFSKKSYRIFLLVHYLHIPLIVFLCLHVNFAVLGFIPGICLQGW